MNRNQLISKIESMIANGYAETHVGYHAEYCAFNGGEFKRGVYAQIAQPYGGTYRVYAGSYVELLEAVTERMSA